MEINMREGDEVHPVSPKPVLQRWRVGETSCPGNIGIPELTVPFAVSTSLPAF